MQKGDISGLVIVVLVILGIAGFLVFAPKAEPVVYGPVEVTGSSLVVAEPALGAREVLVSVEVIKSGFVTVHQAIGDAPGPIVGASALLAVGSQTDVAVVMTEPLFAGQDYFVLMFADDGDGVYESRIDLPVMSDGVVIKHKLSL